MPLSRLYSIWMHSEKSFNRLLHSSVHPAWENINDGDDTGRAITPCLQEDAEDRLL